MEIRNLSRRKRANHLESFAVKKIALFDMDYTILPYDSLIPFAGYVVRRKPWRIYYLFVFAPAVALYVAGLIGRGGLKRAFLSVLWRLRRSEVETLAKSFAEEICAPLLYADVVREASQLKADGARVILNTASPSFYVKHIAQAAGIDEVVATEIVLEERMPLLPRMEGRNNRGIEKLLRMPELCGPERIHAIQEDYERLRNSPSLYDTKPLPGSIAYSDSSADLPLLRICEEKTLIHPSESLSELGQESGWRILRPARPYGGKFEKYVRLCLCLVGLLRLR